MDERPNLILINPDSWRGDVLGHLGDGAAVTPNLDDLVASDAVSFRNAFCQNPVCTPSRCSFMTGWYPHVRGHRTMHHMLHPDEPMLLRALKEDGYYVWWGGKNDLVAPQFGYDLYCDERHDAGADGPKAMWMTNHESQWRGSRESDAFYSFYVGQLETEGAERYFDRDWANVEAAIRKIAAFAPQREGLRGQRQPFCLYLPLTYPHPPYAVEEPWFSCVKPEALPERISWESLGDYGSLKPSMIRGIRERQGLAAWDEQRWTALRRTYYGMCARVDFQIGQIVSALRVAGLYDNTAVIVFSDHGDFTGDFGLVEKTQNTFEDCLTRVPFVIKPPRSRSVRPGVSDALVELVDLVPTVAEMVGLELQHRQFGRSLSSVLAGSTTEHRDAVFCEGGRLDGETEAMQLESGQGPERLYWPRLTLQAGSGPEHTKAVMCRTSQFKYVARLSEMDELYDLRADPAERQNRILDGRYEGIVADLRARLARWWLETADVVPGTPDPRD